MLLSMIVLITSCAPVLARSTPGIPPHTNPPSAPAINTIGIARMAGTSATQAKVATHAAIRPPIRS